MFFLRKDMEILKKGISFLRMIKRLGNNRKAYFRREVSLIFFI